MNISNGFCPKCPRIPRKIIDNNTLHLTCMCDYYDTFTLSEYYNMIKNIKPKKPYKEIDSSIRSIGLYAERRISNELKDDFEHLNKFKNWDETKETPERKKLKKLYDECLNKNITLLKILTIFVDNYDGSEVMKNNIYDNSNFFFYEITSIGWKLSEYYKQYIVIIPKEQWLLNYKIIYSFPESFGTSNSLLLLQDKRIAVSGTSDVITIYDPAKNYQFEQKQMYKTSRDDQIYSLCQLKNGRLVCSSGNGSITIGAHVIKSAHIEKVNKVIILSNNRIASSSKDIVR